MIMFGTPSTGIGLSYVKEVVKELGGEILFENSFNGAVFFNKVTNPEVDSERSDSMRFFITDDDCAIRSNLSQIMRTKI